jgi:glutathionylspermidine synthase
MHDVGWEEGNSRFLDLDHRPIETIFKLHPLGVAAQGTLWPADLATMSQGQKAPRPVVRADLEDALVEQGSLSHLFAILWELNPNHELLLRAYLDDPRNLKDYLKNPLFCLENKGVNVFRNWVAGQLIDGEPAGMGIRESKGLVTTNTSRFVPHLFR